LALEFVCWEWLCYCYPTRHFRQSPRTRCLATRFCLIGATLYGVSNVWEEAAVRQFPVYHVLSQLGMFGSLVSGIQLVILERKQIASTDWNAEIVGLILAFDVCLFTFYTLTPHLFRLAGATYFNLSLLTSDIYGLAFGVFLFGSSLTIWYPIAYVWIVFGILVYHLKSPTQRHAVADSYAPTAIKEDTDPL